MMSLIVIDTVRFSSWSQVLSICINSAQEVNYRTGNFCPVATGTNLCTRNRWEITIVVGAGLKKRKTLLLGYEKVMIKLASLEKFFPNFFLIRVGVASNVKLNKMCHYSIRWELAQSSELRKASLCLCPHSPVEFQDPGPQTKDWKIIFSGPQCTLGSLIDNDQNDNGLGTFQCLLNYCYQCPWDACVCNPSRNGNGITILWRQTWCERWAGI